MTSRIRWISLFSLLIWAAAAAPVAAQSEATCAQTVTVSAGDTLSILAGRYLGDSSLYGAIVTATNSAAATDPAYAAIANPDVIAVGWRLCLPAGVAAPVAAAGVASEPAPTASPVAADGNQADDPTTVEEAPDPLAARMTEGGPHPLSVEYLRELEYPGSPLTIESTLDSGSNYSRYLVSYLSEGLKINALLTVPQGEAPAEGWPVIIFNHGYIPPEVYRTTERYIAYVDGFARNGYIVLRPDYRGHAFSDGDANGAYGTPDYTIDVLNAVASMKQYPAADPNRIGMWGHSMGGYITLRAMVTNDDIKAGVIWAGVVGSYPDMIERWRRPASSVTPSTLPTRARRWRQQLLEQYGTPEENPGFWASLSANTYVADLSGPIQLHHGTADTDVPIAFSESLNQQIEAAGGEVEFYSYPGDEHNITASFSTAMQRSIEFFDTHVKNLQ